MTLLAISDIEQLNKKQYRLRLNDGQVMQLSISGMFSLHVMQAEREIAQVILQPLSSLNNPEIQPIYRVTNYQAPTGDLSLLAEALLDAMLRIYAWYTRGSIRPFRLHSASVPVAV
ncbi:hypothetical protein SAMN05192566_2496 [Methylophilus rhizosphaerae]|uniref:Uncharacterized protein n=1 Tax=Methylophilus rhizosphaerae TaxID=492660 RepID=A0A1G9EWW9_9PROT|nr:hypothetical protein [Methylophilus rhizosphaerae]SDK80538.1 hypothetical protein SAMN05192566_2496 [Methylophilus rhizosphaerae]